MLGQVADLQFELVRVPQIIGIEKGDEIPAGRLDAGIAGGGDAFDWPGTASGCVRHRLQPLVRIVGTAVIDDHDLDLGIRLGGRRLFDRFGHERQWF